MKQAIIAAVVVIGIIAGAVIFGKEEQASGTPSNNFYGLEQADVVLTEYGDFECPACAAFYPILDQVKEQYKDQIRFEFKHFPLVQIHPNATAAHRAAEAAGMQGKFWEMHDLLYERQASWRSSGAVGPTGQPIGSSNPTETFEQYARELDLDIEKFNADVMASETLATINADIDEGKSNGAQGTPSFVLNGKLIEDTTSVDTLEEWISLIDAELGIESGPVENNEAKTNTTEDNPQDQESSEQETIPEETE